MNNTDQRLEQLAARARKAALPPTDDIPFGFATRVLADARVEPVTSPIAIFSLWSLPVSAAAVVACVLVNWWWPSGESSEQHLADLIIQTQLSQ